MISRILEYCEFIKIGHTVFALPFCMIAAVLAGRKTAFGWEQGALILIAFAAARSFAMAMNRILDKDFDAENPRTAGRHIPVGIIKPSHAAKFAGASAILFVAAAFFLQPICFYLAPLVLAYLAFYSYTKRFTKWSHLVLGGALALAPLGAETAIRGNVSWPTAVLALSVMFWVSGFDIFYACQDVDFDRKAGLFSLPAGIGEGRALAIAAGFHMAAFLLFLLYGRLESMGTIYFAAQGLILLLLVYEHLQIRRGRGQSAFFQINGILSIVQLAAVLLDQSVGGK